MLRLKDSIVITDNLTLSESRARWEPDQRSPALNGQSRFLRSGWSKSESSLRNPEEPHFLKSAEDLQDRSDMLRLIEGCDEAMEGIVKRHSERLFSHLIRILRDKCEAQEALQDAFVRVFKHRRNFDLEHRFSTWLYAIALNLARDRLRRRARRPEFVSLETNGESEDEDLKETLLDAHRSPDEATADREWWHLLDDAMGKLPEPLRRSLISFAEDDKSHLQIAAEMGCTAKAVELRLYHARKRLHRLLKKVSRT